MTNGSMTRGELAAYIEANGFVRGQDRIGVQVYRLTKGKRIKHELAVAATSAHVYDLNNGRRRLQSWSLS